MRISLCSVPAPIINLVARINAAGGRGLLVGGSVIDILQDRGRGPFGASAFVAKNLAKRRHNIVVKD
jgi:hypothetical protein